MSGGLSQKHVGHKHEEIVLHLFALYLFAFTGFPIGLIELAAELASCRDARQPLLWDRVSAHRYQADVRNHVRTS